MILKTYQAPFLYFQFLLKGKYLYNPFQNTSYRLEKSSFRFQNMINNIKNNNQEKLIKVYKDRYIIKK